MQLFLNSEVELKLKNNRKIMILAAAMTISSLSVDMNLVNANERVPDLIEVENLNWIKPPQLPGLSFTWVSGSEREHGLYVLRVRLNKGTKIPAHTHPDQRLSTVLSGTLYVGFGETYQQQKLMAVEPGNAYIAPANTPHFIWAKDGDVVYQETGVGPTATQMIVQ